MTDQTTEPEREEGKAVKCTALLSGNDYVFVDIEEYEKITEITVNDAFRVGWEMARITNKQLGAL